MVSSVYQIVYQSKSAGVGFTSTELYELVPVRQACSSYNGTYLSIRYKKVNSDTVTLSSSSRLSLKYSCLNIRPFTRILRQVVHLALICAKTEKTKIGPERKIIKDFHSTLVCNNFLQRNEVRNDVKPGSSFLLTSKIRLHHNL